MNDLRKRVASYFMIREPEPAFTVLNTAGPKEEISTSEKLRRHRLFESRPKQTWMIKLGPIFRFLWLMISQLSDPHTRQVSICLKFPLQTLKTHTHLTYIYLKHLFVFVYIFRIIQIPALKMQSHLKLTLNCW